MSKNTSSWASFVLKGEATKQYDVNCATFGAMDPKGFLKLTCTTQRWGSTMNGGFTNNSKTASKEGRLTG